MSILGTLTCDMTYPLRKLFKVSVHVACEGGEIELFNFLLPTLYHSITVTKGGVTRIEKAYSPEARDGLRGKGEDWWMTYRYQLEGFVDRVKGRNLSPETPWITKLDSIGNLHWIEKIYEKVGLFDNLIFVS